MVSADVAENDSSADTECTLRTFKIAPLTYSSGPRSSNKRGSHRSSSKKDALP
jgi:hypothetical protein